jgi:hypothetical protein
MSKRWRWLLLLIPVGILLLWLWPSSAVPPTDDGKAAATHAAPTADLGSDDGGPPQATRLSGRVLEHGDAGVAGALVVAADGLGHLRQTHSAEAGAFRFEELAPGDWTLAAQAGPATCEPVGPIPVAPGDDLRDIDLHLVPGVALSGRVLDLHNRSGIAGARLEVVAAAFTATSAADGRYAFPGVPAGKQMLLVEAQGFLPRKVAIDYPAGSSAPGLDVFLRAATRVEGIVVDKGGGGVPGATLWLWRYRAAGAEVANLTPLGVQTNDDGTFAVDVEAGLVRLVARMSGMAEGQSDQLDLAEGQRRKGVRLTLGAGGEVDGLVLGPNGSPVNAGQVQALGGPGRWPVGQADVDKSGHFHVTGIPAGHVVVVADAAQARGSAEADLDEGGSAEVEIRLGDGALDGTVVDADGRAVSGALVVARPVGLGDAGERQTLSSTDGRFHLGGLSGARFDVAASKDDGSAELRGVAAGSHDVQLSLAVGSVSGYVETPDSGGVSDFTLSAEPEVPGRGRPRSSHVLDGRGEFKLVLAPGSYLVRASAPGYADGVAHDVSVSSGQATSGVHIELRASGTIEGVVLDSASGAPLVGIHVSVDRAHAWAVGRSGTGGAQMATSGLDGRFVLRDISPGSWPLFADSPDYEMAGAPPPVTVTPGGDSPSVEIRMKRSTNGREQEYAGIGMSIWDAGGSKYAAEVFPGGPAYEAGIRSGDQILSVDGTSAQSLALPDLVAQIRGPVGTEISLDMQRGNGGPSYGVVVPRADIKMF